VVETFKPAKVEDTDVTIKVIGSIVCGSDLHLYYSVVVELQKGDILGHEFCDVVDSVGPKISKVKLGDCAVCRFQTACGSYMYFKRKLRSQCEKTNDNKVENIIPKWAYTQEVHWQFRGATLTLIIRQLV
jgi:threonine dehydrogenase-like Zn-dependent dehydrogenase